MEVEFSSVEEAESFTAPDYFGRDVTQFEQYQNSSLSTMNMEQIKELLDSVKA